MSLHRRGVLKILAASGTTLVAGEVLAGAPIERDVAIVGGGGAGTYAALRLRDLGHSVVVLERTQRLGGHAETFRDPVTGVPIDIGVQVFPDNTLVRGYFGRFGVPLITAPLGGGTSLFVDFRTGLPVDAFNPGGAELGAALVQYLQILTGQFGFLELNGFHLPPPGPVLDKLLLPFGQFAQENNLNALLPIFSLFEQGFGPLLSATTLYVLKNMSAAVVGALLTGTFLAAPTGTGTLYDAATAALAGDVLFGARITDVERRDGDRVHICVRTAEGVREIRARKLLVTAPPLLSNFAGFDLDLSELSTFSRFQRHHYWTAVAKISGALGASLVNAAPETPFNLAPLPGIYSLRPTFAPGLVDVKYGSSEDLSDDRVRDNIRRDVARVALPGIGPLHLDAFAIFKNHSPYSLVASPRQIRNGFYNDLASLQGRNKTFYAGAAFQTHSSAAIWAYLEELLPTIFA